MPIPIICLESTLRQYAEAFRQSFTWPQFQHFVTVLLGLVLAPERRTLTGLLSRVAGVASLSALRRFRQQLAPAVQAEHARQGAQQPGRRGRCKSTQVTAFAIFDDTTMAKHLQGETEKRMAGVGQHYSSTAGQVVQGHSLVVGLLEVLGRRCPLPPMLYRQQAVAQTEGVAFQSKVDLVIAAIQALLPVPGSSTHILVDSWYSGRRLWRTALGRGFAITGGIRSNRWLRLPDPQRPGCRRKVRLRTSLSSPGVDGR